MRKAPFANRGDWGTSHGWASAHSVAWNVDATDGGAIVCQQPPTAQNYAIGWQGSVAQSWFFDGEPGFVESDPQSSGDPSLARPLYPPSLYEAQLAQRPR